MEILVVTVAKLGLWPSRCHTHRREDVQKKWGKNSRRQVLSDTAALKYCCTSESPGEFSKSRCPGHT